LDASCEDFALADFGSGRDEAQVLLPSSSTRQQVPTSMQAILTQGGQRLLARKMLTRRIGLPQAGHCISAVGNDPPDRNGGFGWAGAGALGNISRTLLSISRRLGPKKPY
jgi:hypothetical protein